MTYQSTRDDLAQDTNTFYRRTLHVLSDAQVPFLVGGSHAFLHYTGIERNTKDFDLHIKAEDRGRALEALDQAGYRTDVTFPHWLAKAFQGGDHVDLVYSSGNGICSTDDAWFEHSVDAEVLGMPVRLVPLVEFLWQKAFIMERERFDGADVMHILHVQAEHLDWERLIQRFGPHWQLLLSHLVFFCFAYPCEAHRIPAGVIGELVSRLQQQLAAGQKGQNGQGAEGAERDHARICQGTLVSRQQYLLDIGRWGYRDARLVPIGRMTPEDAVYWTWAIEHVK